ncbi:MAG: contact-dependent growth inhibition system immunity protein [Clostridia bacterium]|nr:contact-dependent growth inhibition system immunity protein [Clostridia bacterium]
MKPPVSFQKFCELFHQDIDLVYDNPEDLLGDFVEDQSQDELAKFEKFLSEIIGSELSNEEIDRLWEECGARIEIKGITMKEFFIDVLQRIRTVVKGEQ